MADWKTLQDDKTLVDEPQELYPKIPTVRGKILRTAKSNDNLFASQLYDAQGSVF